MSPPDEPGVWVFNGDGGGFPSGVFQSVEKAEEWISKHGLSGLLTWYPLDVGVYEWAIENGYFSPHKDYHKAADFIQRFSSAHTDHHHYKNGRQAGLTPDDTTQALD
jgi:hypothetical protein